MAHSEPKWLVLTDLNDKTLWPKDQAEHFPNSCKYLFILGWLFNWYKKLVRSQMATIRLTYLGILAPGWRKGYFFGGSARDRIVGQVPWMSCRSRPAGPAIICRT